jgi:hypothetical protein
MIVYGDIYVSMGVWGWSIFVTFGTMVIVDCDMMMTQLPMKRNRRASFFLITKLSLFDVLCHSKLTKHTSQST